MRKDKSPAYQHYPKDILSSTRVALMTLEEEGAYRRAIDYCWLGGSLPNDPEKLATVIGKGCSIAVATTVQQMFIIDKKNSTKLLHDRLEVERRKQKLFRQKKIKAGRESARKRKERKELEPKNDGQHVLNCVDDVLPTNAQQNSTLLSPISRLQSSDLNTNPKERERENTSRARAPDVNGKSLIEKAAAQLEIHRRYYPDFSGSFNPHQIELLASMTDLQACELAFRHAAGNDIKPSSIARIVNEVYANKEWESRNVKPNIEDTNEFIRNYGKPRAGANETH